MKELKTFTVDGESYVVQMYTTSVGMFLLTDIMNLLGADVVRVALAFKDGLKNGASVADFDLDIIDADMMTKAIDHLSSKAAPELLDSIFKRILSGTIIQKQGSTTCADAYDTHFQGRYSHLFKVLWKSLGVQYGDFLSVLGGLVKTAKGKAGLKSLS